MSIDVNHLISIIRLKSSKNQISGFIGGMMISAFIVGFERSLGFDSELGWWLICLCIIFLIVCLSRISFDR